MIEIKMLFFFGIVVFMFFLLCNQKFDVEQIIIICNYLGNETKNNSL
jgi:hypothetical protein